MDSVPGVGGTFLAERYGALSEACRGQSGSSDSRGYEAFPELMIQHQRRHGDRSRHQGPARVSPNRQHHAVPAGFLFDVHSVSRRPRRRVAFAWSKWI